MRDAPGASSCSRGPVARAVPASCRQCRVTRHQRSLRKPGIHLEMSSRCASVRQRFREGCAEPPGHEERPCTSTDLDHRDARGRVPRIGFSRGARARHRFEDVAAATALCLLAVVAAGAVAGGSSAIVASVLSFLGLNFFFAEPRPTLAVRHASDVVALIAFLLSDSSSAPSSAGCARNGLDRNVSNRGTLPHSNHRALHLRRPDSEWNVARWPDWRRRSSASSGS